MLDQPDTFVWVPSSTIHASLRQMKFMDDIAAKKQMNADEILRHLYAASLIAGEQAKKTH